MITNAGQGVRLPITTHRAIVPGPSAPDHAIMFASECYPATKAVCRHFGMTLMDILSVRRMQHIARARQIAMWLSRHTTHLSLPQIGRAFGGRDHTTVLYACSRIDQLTQRDAGFAAVVNGMLAGLQKGET